MTGPAHIANFGGIRVEADTVEALVEQLRAHGADCDFDGVTLTYRGTKPIAFSVSGPPPKPRPRLALPGFRIGRPQQGDAQPFPSTYTHGPERRRKW